MLKWSPTNAKDNSQDGYTGPTILDAYQMDGTHMWRINLGINIRSGAHYTQFLVYDFDGTQSPTPVRSVQFNQSSALNISIYPNPAPKDFTITINRETSRKYSLKITNPSGKIIRRKSGSRNKMHIKALPPGVYILQINSGNNAVTRRLISY